MYYLSIKTDYLVDVFFDDLKVVHQKSPVIQANDYYPFGLTFNSYQRENSIPNRFLYNEKEIQQELDINWYDYGARIYMPELGRWSTIDPLADSSWSYNPYHFVSNNPINRIDPDGRDDFEVNRKGEIVNRIKNEEVDNVYIVNKDGTRVEGQSTSFEYGTITAVRNPKMKSGKKEIGLTVLEVNGDDNAQQLFEFLADPASTGVEWTHASIGTEDSGKNIVGTSHDDSSTAVGAYLRGTGYTLKEVVHNHPKSGIALPSEGDRRGAVEYHKKNSKTTLAVYAHPNQYVMYDAQGAIGFYIK